MSYTTKKAAEDTAKKYMKTLGPEWKIHLAQEPTSGLWYYQYRSGVICISPSMQETKAPLFFAMIATSPAMIGTGPSWWSANYTYGKTPAEAVTIALKAARDFIKRMEDIKKTLSTVEKTLKG